MLLFLFVCVWSAVVSVVTVGDSLTAGVRRSRVPEERSQNNCSSRIYVRASVSRCRSHFTSCKSDSHLSRARVTHVRATERVDRLRDGRDSRTRRHCWRSCRTTQTGRNSSRGIWACLVKLLAKSGDVCSLTLTTLSCSARMTVVSI